jgi:TPR repeat protein
MPGSIGHEGNGAWYRNMNEKEWTELDNSMNLRAMHASEDQMPALEKQANKGNVIAMTTLAMVERAGRKSTVDMSNGHRFRSNPNLTRAIKWYRKAANAGFPIAQTELAEMLYRGRETDANKPEAMRLFTQAAQANYPRAQIDLAQLQLEEGKTPADMQHVLDTMMKNTRAIFNQATPMVPPH